MLRHHYIAPLFILLFALPFTVDYFSTLPWIYFLILTILFLGFEFYGASHIQSNFHLKAICSIEANEKTIALTFDDGPSSETLAILDVLKEFNYKATFFCIGKHIADREDILQRIHSDGHTIGNHSFSHGFFFDLKTRGSFITDLLKASESIRKVIGKTPLLFRPPYGVTTPALSRAIKKLNYTTIGWNIRSFDTLNNDKNKVMKRIEKGLSPGSILLLHDTLKGNAVLVREILLYLREKKYKVVPLETLIDVKAYA
jgi:peptidoglycan-N-acetylglucosamine deacetylase